MQHMSSFDTIGATATTTDGSGLVLLPITGCDDAGRPQLAGAQSAMILDPMPQGDPCSYLAVCKHAQMDGRLVVLGYVPLADAVVAVGAARPQQDIVIGTGKAQLRLTRDGRVRVTGEDVRMNARGRMRLGGATIDLN